MPLILKKQLGRMLENARRRLAEPGFDPKPVVKLFCNPAATWLLDSIVPDREDVAYGLCDLGVGRPELGYVSLKQLEQLNGGSEFGFGVERDVDFDAKLTTRDYAMAARQNGRIEA